MCHVPLEIMCGESCGQAFLITLKTPCTCAHLTIRSGKLSSTTGYHAASPVSSARAQRGEAWPQGPPSPPSRRLRRHCRGTSIQTNSSGCGGGDRPAHQSDSLENQLVARSRAISSQPTTLQREVRSVRAGVRVGGSMATVGMEARSRRSVTVAVGVGVRGGEVGLEAS